MPPTPRSQEESAARISSLNAERDDLKALLVATLKRLEAVDEMVQRADVSSSVMQEKVSVYGWVRGQSVSGLGPVLCLHTIVLFSSLSFSLLLCISR